MKSFPTLKWSKLWNCFKLFFIMRNPSQTLFKLIIMREGQGVGVGVVVVEFLIILISFNSILKAHSFSIWVGFFYIKFSKTLFAFYFVLVRVFSPSLSLSLIESLKLFLFLIKLLISFILIRCLATLDFFTAN